MSKSWVLNGIPADTLTSKIVDDRRWKVDDQAARDASLDFDNKYGATISIDDIHGIKVISLPRNEVLASRGEYFVGASNRIAVPSGDVYYYRLITGAKSSALEDIKVYLDYSNLGDGIFEYSLELFDSLSDGNNWSYTGGSPEAPAGRNINTNVLVGGLAASKSESKISAGGVGTVTGDSDFFLVFKTVVLDQTGADHVVSSISSTFFSDNKRLLMRSNSSYLIRAAVSGTAAGTVDIRAQFSLSESSIGINL